MGPYPRSPGGKRFLLVTTDLYSRWVEAFSLGSYKAHITCSLLEKEVFSHFGYLKALI